MYTTFCLYDCKACKLSVRHRRFENMEHSANRRRANGSVANCLWLSISSQLVCLNNHFLNTLNTDINARRFVILAYMPLEYIYIFGITWIIKLYSLLNRLYHISSKRHDTYHIVQQSHKHTMFPGRYWDEDVSPPAWTKFLCAIYLWTFLCFVLGFLDPPLNICWFIFKEWWIFKILLTITDRVMSLYHDYFLLYQVAVFQ